MHSQQNIKIPEQFKLLCPALSHCQ